MPAIEHSRGRVPPNRVIKSDLVAYYDAQAAERTEATLTPDRTEAHRVFIGSLRGTTGVTVVDVGAGTGQDAAALTACGVRVLALDLSHEHCRWSRRRGVAAAVADLYRLPLATGTVEALWSASAYMHVPSRDIDAAIAEAARVLRGGAPAMIGVWAGRPVEETRMTGDRGRFYSIRPSADWLDLIARHLDVERSWTDDTGEHGRYLWVLVRGR